MASETIREFLVALGYKVDTSGERKFVDGVKNVSKEVAALGVAAVATATAVMAGVTKMANGLEELYFTSQRTRASAENIKALGFAADNLGSSSDAARGSIEALAKFLRINPGGESLIKSWGIQTRDANGELRDTTELLTDLGKLFRSMPYAQAYARANVLGIDEKTLQAIIKGTDQFSDRYKQILARYGLDVTKATELSHQFNISLRDLKANFEVLGTVVGVRIIGILNELEYRWNSLDASTKDNIKTTAEWIAGLVAGLAVILGGPVVWIGALATAIGLLWDDYKVWKEGGKSLIDWAKWEPGITAATDGIKTLVGWIEKLEAATSRALDSLGKWAAQKLASGDSLGKAGSLGRKVFEGIAYANGYDPRTGTKIPENAQSNWNGMSPSEKKGYIDRYQALSGGAKKAYDTAFPELSASIRKELSGPAVGDALGLRQNNPGNLRTGPGGTFGSYATPQEGLNALSNQLSLYFTGQSAAAGHKKLLTVRDILSTYAPSSENNTGAYIADVAGRLGVSPDAQLNLNDVATKAKLMQAITLHEQGRNPYSDAMYQQAAGAQLSTQTTINVYGPGNPQETASAVGREQDSVNQRLVRNFQTTAAM